MPQDRKKPDDADHGDARNKDRDAELDQALMDTFPGSDPVSLSSPTKAGRPNHKATAKDAQRDGAPDKARPGKIK